MAIAKDVRRNWLKKATMAINELLQANRMPIKARLLFSAWEQRAWAFFRTLRKTTSSLRAMRLTSATASDDSFRTNRMPIRLDRSFPPGSVEPGHFLLRGLFSGGR